MSTMIVNDPVITHERLRIFSQTIGSSVTVDNNLHTRSTCTGCMYEHDKNMAAKKKAKKVAKRKVAKKVAKKKTAKKRK